MNNKYKSNNILKFLYYKIFSIYYYLIELIYPPEITDYKNIPIIINNFNRFDSLKKLILSLEKRGYSNIYIIDNHSTYPPLIKYYQECRYKVFHLNENIGMDALWKTEIFKKFKKNYFVYTDSDIEPIEECPDDFLLFFLLTLKKYKLARKVGFSLKIDDLPDSYLLKQEVISWEKRFFHYFNHRELLYRAPIDTTFALYRPRGKRKHANNHIEMYRTAYPYMARHLPWYTDSLKPDDETQYFLKRIRKPTYWSEKSRLLLTN